jgi:hypothetical protein
MPDPVAPTLLFYGAGGSAVGDPVSSIVVLPNTTATEDRLGVASRSPGTALGRTIILDASIQRGQQWLLHFDQRSTPVRTLVTHAAAYRQNDDGSLTRVLRAGERIFGVLDESACGDSTECPGILAVDGWPTLASGSLNPRFAQRSIDVTGAPMVPVRLGIGLTSGLSLAPLSSRQKPGVALAVPGGTKTMDLMGVVTTTNGIIYFFDASELRVIDIGLGPAVSSLIYADSANNVLAAGGYVSTYVPGPVPSLDSSTTASYPAIVPALGASANEFVTVTYHGIITGFRGLATATAPDGSLTLPYGTADITRLRPGVDRISITGDSCAADILLTAIDAPNGLLRSDHLADVRCAGTSTFSVRAGESGTMGASEAYVVEGTGSGYMGRTGNGQSFRYPADSATTYSHYYYHPDGFDPVNPQPQFQFAMGPGDPNIQQDWYYSMKVDPNFAPEFISVDLSLGVEFHTPGNSTYVGALPDSTDVSRLYVAYPTANAVLEFALQLVTPNSPNVRSIAAFR